MKKLVVLITLIVAPFLVSAQTFDSFENEKDVTSVVVTKNMFKLLSKIDLESNDPDAKEYMELVNNLENIKIYTTDNPEIAERMNNAVTGYVGKSNGLSELMRVNDDGKNIKFYSKEGKNENFVSELLMHLNGMIDGKKTTVIMSITGNIDLKKISKLTQDLKVPGSEELKNIDKKEKIVSMVLFKYIIALGVMALALFGCNSEQSLQRYLVDKQEDNNFVKIDLATSLLKSENAQFTQEEQDILNTVKKINVVAYPIKKENAAEYEAEKNKLKEIIGQDQYKTLIKYGSNYKGATLKYLGEEDAIDELIVFASDDERGFAIFRLLGDNMRPDSMLKLMNSINNGDIDASQLKTIGEIFNTKGDSI